MSECPGINLNENLEPPDWQHCEGCAVHGGDRLDARERLIVEVARFDEAQYAGGHRESWSERTKRADVRALVAILDRLAPRPDETPLSKEKNHG